MQPTARRTLVVAEASAERRATDSSRGFASKLSPTHTASKTPAASACCAIWMSSLTLTAPMMTPRLAKVRPKDALMLLCVLEVRMGCQGTRRRILGRLDISTIMRVDTRSLSDYGACLRRIYMEVSFRGFLQTLRKHDELLEISRPVDPRNIAALVPQSDKALLFTNVVGYSMPVVSGLLQSRNRLSLAMGVSYEGIEKKLRMGMDRPIQPKVVKKAPVKEVILTKNKVDLYQLPVPIFSTMDGGPMITGAVVIAEDPEYGMNAGMYRLMLKKKNVTDIDIVTPNNLRRYAERALQKKKPLPISISIGTHPYEMMATTFKASLR